MRLSKLTQLLKLNRIQKLRKDFLNPFTALLCISGISKHSFTLYTQNGHEIISNRNDAPIWHEYFYNDSCEIKIEKDLFHIIPKNKDYDDYFIKGAHNLFTFQPKRPSHQTKPKLLDELEQKEQGFYSQHGEDGIVKALLSRIPVKHKFIVEFGAHDGINMSNSRYLIEEHDWSALLIEADPQYYKKLQPLYSYNSKVITELKMLSKENINQVFHHADVPEDFDILSVDVDGPDYYLWEALTDFKPSIVIVEYNSAISSDIEYVVPENNASDFGGTTKEGASLLSFCKLGRQKDYIPVYTELSGSNLFFIHKRHAHLFNLDDITPEALYQPPQFGSLAGGISPNGRGYK